MSTFVQENQLLVFALVLIIVLVPLAIGILPGAPPCASAAHGAYGVGSNSELRVDVLVAEQGQHRPLFVFVIQVVAPWFHAFVIAGFILHINIASRIAAVIFAIP